jgi:transcription initiation factor TFIID TATA-box-binding protein
MEIFNNISGFYSEGIDYPIKTPINNPVFLNLDDDSNSNSHITYYNQIYGTSNINANTDNNPIQNLLDNHNIEHQEEKSNDAINSLAKEDKSTDINTNEIGMPQPRIVNIVSMVNLCKKLNLREIALQCSNSEYNPSRINAVIMRIKEPKTAALIFNSGVIIVLGARDEENSKKAAKIFAKNIKQLGYDVKFKDFKIVNIVATCDLKFPIKLTKLSLELNAKLSNNPINNSDKKQCFYEPDTFPGLIYHMRNPQLTILVFKSGKINFVGAKNRNDIFDALGKVYPLLHKYKNDIMMKQENDEDINEAEFSNINNL